ncbi:non-ribosomal peptide synthetase [Streptomyces griseofuscus]
MPNPSDIIDAYPLTRLQAGMLYHSLQDPDTPTYHDVSVIRLAGRFDETALHTVLTEIIQHSDILRTSVDLSNFSQPMQLVHASVPTPLAVDDLREIPEEEQRRRAEDWTAREKATAFDLASAPLLRVHVHVFGDEDFQVGISFHHAILDGWSLSLVTSQLLTGYNAMLAGRSAPATTPVTRFRDYVMLEQEALASAEARDYWTSTLDDTAFTGIFRDNEPGLTNQRQAQVFDVPLPDGITAGLRSVAAQAKVTVKAVMFAAHARVLALLSGHTRVVTGRVSNGRPETTDGDETIGLFLNTLPLVAEVAEVSWIELAQQIHRQESEALPHRRYPMAQMLQDLQRLELFETVVDHRNFRSYDMPLDQIAIVSDDFFEQTNFPFTANFGTDPRTGDLRLRINFDRAAFSEQRIAEIGGHYAAALTALTADPTASAMAANLLGVEQLDRLVRHWNDTAMGLPSVTLPELLTKQADTRASSVALRTDGAELTYAELHARSNRLAWHLRELGVGPDVLVGVHLARSAELIVSLLAVLKAGGAYVPLDPEYPKDRLQYMLADARVAVLLCDPELAGTLQSGDVPVLAVDIVDDTYPDHAPPLAVTPEHLAYVIYTSGSTGRPKGVQVTHGALLNLLLSFQRDLAFTDHDRLLAVTSLSFDIAALEVYLPLMTGAELVLAPNIAAVGIRLREFLEHSGTTFIQATPSSWQLLMEAGLQRNAAVKAISGGEALPADLASELTSRFPAVWNAYGPTETTIWSSLQRLRPNDPVTLGHPIANTRTYVLDHALNPVPEGVPGDLYIAGAGLARGYLGRADLTADRFLPDPFARDGGRMYCTGDVVRRLPSGALDFLGRADHQVKVRGYRIELGEIEAVLSQHPGVGSVTVTAREDRVGYQRLVAYVTPQSAALSAAELRAAAASALPAYMVPGAFVVLDAFPLTPNGKIDRDRLPSPGADELATKTFIKPRTATERAIAEIWCDVLGIDQISATDNFLELGGNSLAALRVIMRLRSLAKRDIPFAALPGSTLEEIAEIIDGERETGSSVVLPLRPTGSKPPLFFVHSLGGSVVSYADLSEALDADQPFHAIQAPEYAGPQVPKPETIEAISELYLADLRAVQPEGPYHLGGWCMGGIVAYEMARQLQAAGERIGSLTIVSASIDDPVPPRYITSDAAAILGAFADKLPITEDELEAMNPDARLECVLRLAQGTESERVDASNVEDLRRLVRLYQRHARALISYRDTPRKPYRGDVLLIRAEQGPFPGWDYGWKQRIDGQLLIDETPGEHLSMILDANAAKLASRIAAALAGRPAGVLAR